MAVEWIQAAVAGADLGAFAIDAQTRVVQLDTRAGEMLGLAAHRELAFAEYLAALDPGDREASARYVDAAVLAVGDVYHDEFRTVTKHWIAADGRTQRDRPGGRTALRGLVSDITLRRSTEDARSRLVDDMGRALRFNDMLVGVVTHDLRTPLAVVALSTGQLAKELTSPALEGAVSRAARAGERMSRIVEQMMDLTQGRLDGRLPLRPAATDLDTIVRAVATELATGNRAPAIAVAARGDTTCVCDADRVAQIVSNLLGNAVRHGAGAGVRVELDGTSPAEVAIAVISVGAIAPEVVPTLFNPFRRLSAERAPRDRSHGLGLGLYIARRIALGHGGDITVTATADDTTFRVVLPRATAVTSFSLIPGRVEEEQVLLQGLASADQSSSVTAAMFGVVPIEQRAPDAFARLVDRHVRILDLSLARQIYRDARVNLAAELRELAEQLGGLGAGAGDVAELHSQALQRAIKSAPAVKVQALVNEGRLIALELMGRLLTYYRKRSGFGSLARGRTETMP